MTRRYKGATLSANAATTTGGESGVAAGSWTLAQQAQAQSSGTWPMQPIPNYIEEVFSTYLYTGNNAARTITNGIDLAGKGGLIWTKQRAGPSNEPHILVDTVRGFGQNLSTNNTDAQKVNEGSLTGFTSTGYTISNQTVVNGLASYNYASWTFRKQPKFFDVVTYTGDGTTNRQIPHSLSSIPGMLTTKRTDAAGSWNVQHRSMAGGDGTAADWTRRLLLESTTSSANSGMLAPTSAVFYATDGYNLNGATYVAYLFAHNAGGFGATGTENVVSCGSFTVDDNGFATVNLGYEPQFVIAKSSSTAGSWDMFDSMRGLTVTTSQLLFSNQVVAETSVDGIKITSTGFTVNGNFGATAPNATYIYIAIRRGPMKVPTDGTKVFKPALNTNSASGSSGNPNYLTNFPVDLAIRDYRPGGVGIASPSWQARLTGTNYLVSSTADSEYPDGWYFDSQTGFYYPTAGSNSNQNGWFFRRAPGFFDEVCYTGTGYLGNAQNAHNLGVVPELMIVKRRSSAGANWYVYTATTGNTNRLQLNTTDAVISTIYAWNSTTPTASYFYVGDDGGVNGSGSTYVNYLFATCPGVSKVGSYTGTGATQTIACGFAAGARFVLIKRTDSTGDWYVWDSARGMVSGTDPSLMLNSTAAEVNANSIYAATTGFQIVSTAAGINASGGTYIFLAIA